MLGVGTADSKSSRSTMKQRNQKGFEVGRIAFSPCKNRDTDCDWRIRGILLYHEQNRNLNPWRRIFVFIYQDEQLMQASKNFKLLEVL